MFGNLSLQTGHTEPAFELRKDVLKLLVTLGANYVE